MWSYLFAGRPDFTGRAKNLFFLAILFLGVSGAAAQGNDAATIPELALRVNYGHDWVESFYEAGHTAQITVTDAAGNVKATAEAITEAKDFWDGATGFNTQPENWNPAPPDIQPYDWVYGVMENGASAQVQIGDIRGTINPGADSMRGVITAPWFADEVMVECHAWGAPEPAEARFDSVLADGSDGYACSWAGEWDIQPGQDVGGSYYGADGHWVANAFFASDARIIASTAGDWFWTTGFIPGSLDLFIYESAAENGLLLWQGSHEANEWGHIGVGYEDHGQDLSPGHYVVVSDGVTEKGLILEPITMEAFDTQNEIMAGTAPAGREVQVVAGMAEAETQGAIPVIADPASGAWSADFKTIGFDITEPMRAWSFAQILDEDGDASEAGAPPPPTPWLRAHPVWEAVDAWAWPEDAILHLTIDDPATPAAPDLEMDMPGEFDPALGSVWFEFGGVYDLKPGDIVTLSDGTTLRYLVVSVLTIDAVDVEADTAAGTAEAFASVYLPTPDQALLVTANGSGMWAADFHDAGIDLVSGAMVIAEVYDPDGDLTSFEWEATPAAPTVELLYPDLTGAFIELHAEPALPGLWTRIQWQDASGNWHDVAGWQGTFDENQRVLWYVGADHLGTGPFRWLVYASEQGDLLGMSAPFALPAGHGEVLRVWVSYENRSQ